MLYYLRGGQTAPGVRATRESKSDIARPNIARPNIARPNIARRRLALTGMTVLASIWAVSVHAQAVPAEFPPASYGADQYIDSAGCVFVRVGSGPATEWIPRVGRDRSQICGQRPSGVTASAPVAAPANDSITIIAEPAPAPAPVVAAPAPVSAAAPIIVAPAPVHSTGCPGMPSDLQPYFYGDNVRCGPQANHPGAQQTSSLGGGAGGGQSSGYVAQSFELSAPPPGYRTAWDDGRLNPYRGIGTPAGEAQMNQIWTQTVPRGLAPADVPAGYVVVNR